MKKIKYFILCIVACMCVQVNALTSFSDVNVGDSYYDAVNWALENGVTTGTGSSKFMPNNNCSRAEFVTFMWRSSSSPISNKKIPFKDVKNSAYYYNAVKWAYEKGITYGTSNTAFNPNKALTNAESIAFLYRLNGSPTVSGNIPFKDVNSNSYYYNAVLWAYNNNIISGNSYFYPNKKLTRGEAIKLIYANSMLNNDTEYSEIEGVYYSPLQGSNYINSCYQYETKTPGCNSSKKIVHDISVTDNSGKATEGAPIYAANDGTAIFYQVYSSKNSNVLISYGNYVKLTTTDGSTIIYAHLQKFEDSIESLIGHSYTTCPKNSSKVGYSAGPCPQSNYASSVVKYVSSKKVKRGELIGYLGSTGNAYMPHLHMEIKKSGVCVSNNNIYNDYFNMNYNNEFGSLGKCDMVDIYNKQFNNGLSSNNLKALCNWYGSNSSPLCK